MTGSWVRRRETPVTVTQEDSPTHRTTPRERRAIVGVLMLCVCTAIGSGAWALTHTVDLAVPASLGRAVGGARTPPPTSPAPTSPAATSKPTGTAGSPISAKPSAKPSAKATAQRKIVIPRNAPLTYTRNTATSRSSGAGRVIRFDVRVQKGLPYDVDDVAAQIATTLNDPHSWRADRRQRFQLVRAGDDAELHAYVVTPGTTDQLCAPLRTRGQVSCQLDDRVVLNARRWAYAVPEFAGRTPLYRQYLVNHEFGHYLGNGHVGCPGTGRIAPVMMQQTKGLDGCRANAWPYPKKP